ncbi:MAG: hypothetical protein JNL57_07165 [Bacteroidetes bacterium]|nr:hypothetical protein [Bacteroidota bacterium]
MTPVGEYSQWLLKCKPNQFIKDQTKVTGGNWGFYFGGRYSSRALSVSWGISQPFIRSAATLKMQYPRVYKGDTTYSKYSASFKIPSTRFRFELAYANHNRRFNPGIFAGLEFLPGEWIMLNAAKVPESLKSATNVLVKDLNEQRFRLNTGILINQLFLKTSHKSDPGIIRLGYSFSTGKHALIQSGYIYFHYTLLLNMGTGFSQKSVLKAFEE